MLFLFMFVLCLVEFDGERGEEDEVEDVWGERRERALVKGKEDEFERAKPNEEEGGGPT